MIFCASASIACGIFCLSTFRHHCRQERIIWYDIICAVFRWFLSTQRLFDCQLLLVYKFSSLSLALFRRYYCCLPRQNRFSEILTRASNHSCSHSESVWHVALLLPSRCGAKQMLNTCSSNSNSSSEYGIWYARSLSTTQQTCWPTRSSKHPPYKNILDGKNQLHSTSHIYKPG